jgi:hypothetical protein
MERTARALVALVPIAVLAVLGAAFAIVYELAATAEPDVAAILAFSSSSPGLLIAYLATLGMFFNAHPELPWSELE